MIKVKTHLMFQGDVEEAIDLYSSVFSEFKVLRIDRYGAGEPVAAGSLKLAHISFAGHELQMFNSPPVHDFSFTPSISLFVDFDDQEKLENAFATLSMDGVIMMPIDDYGFSKKFGFLADRYGVSWQLNLPE